MEFFLNDRQNLNNTEWAPNDPNIILDNLSNLLKILETFKFHKGSNVYYSAIGFKNLIENLDVLNEIGDYIFTNPIDQLRYLLLNIDAYNWDIIRKQKDNVIYYYQLHGGATPYYINNTTISEACEYQHEGNIVALINLLSSEYNTINPIHVNRSVQSRPPEMRMLPINILDNKNKLLELIKENRIKRNFCLNPKHGENGLNVLSNKDEVVSPLECNRIEAQSLLEDAVSYTIASEMYAFDSVRNKYIVFKFEGTTPQNAFHGYHPIDQNEVPEEVKIFLQLNNIV